MPGALSAGEGSGDPAAGGRLPGPVLAWACILFFLSGAAGLVYEVVWFRRFAHVWGSSALAAAMVLASFLLGLGLGAGAIGRIADRVRVPLRWYGLSEVAIAALALLVPLSGGLLGPAAAALHPFLSGHPLAGSLVRCLLTLIVLGPPCFLMGGTFPLLVRQFTPPGGSLRTSTGLLYALNALGGAAGAWLAGFHLLPALGLTVTGHLAVGTSLAAGLAALVLSGSSRLDPSAGGSTDPAARAPGESPALPPAQAVPLGRVLCASFLAGCASLALQIAWTRQLTLILGGSTYAFSAMLVVVLLGIGLGSLAFHLRVRRAADLRWIQAVIVLGLILTALAGQWSIEALTLLSGAVGRFRGSQAVNGAVCVLGASTLEVLPCLGMGLLLPLHVALAGSGRSGAGRAAGDIYAWNTAGCLAGALGAALLVLPGWGTSATVAAALGLYLLAALLLVPITDLRGRLALAALAAVCSGAVLLASRGPDPVLQNMGLYLYGDYDRSRVLEETAAFHIQEGVSSNVMVLVLNNGQTSLRVNGKVDASNSRDMPMQLGLAYFPRFLRPGAREVLVIGLGSGTTSGASLLFPEAQVTCAEIEPAIAEATTFFESVNHKPLASPRFTLALEDGRSHLAGSRTRYDLILSEPSNPWLAGVSSLFTREFYRAAKDRLAPGGVLAQWIQAYSLEPSDYALVVRTVLDVFPHGSLIRLTSGDTVLLASEADLDPSAADLDRAQGLVDSLPEVKADLAKHFASTDVRSLLLGRRILGEEGLRRLLAADRGTVLNTDVGLRLEFDAPLRLFDKTRPSDAVQKVILRAADGASVAASWERWGCGPTQVPALRSLLDLFAERDEWGAAEAILDFALRIAPSEPYFLAARFMSALPEAEAEWDAGFGRILAASPEEAARVGVWLHLRKDYGRAVRAWRRILEVRPQAATLWVNLAESLEAGGEKDEARRSLEKARGLDPFSAFVRIRAGAADGEE